MEHLADEFDLRWLIGILLLELHYQSKCSIFKRGIGRANDDSIPGNTMVSSVFTIERERHQREQYQVITLSGTGEAETPAGGSVCMRWRSVKINAGRSSFRILE